MERYIRLICYLAIISGIVIFLFLGNYTISLILALLYYTLFGFVTPSFILNIFGDKQKASFLLSLTVPYLLYKVEKAYYYWLKASFVCEFNKDYKKALEFVNKVKENNLTEHDRSMFNSFVACIFFDLKEYEQADLFLNKAKEIPHKQIANEFLNNLERDFRENKDK